MILQIIQVINVLIDCPFYEWLKYLQLANRTVIFKY